MIPWFFVNLVGAVAGLFGLEAYVQFRSGNWWGAEWIHFMRRVPDAQPLGTLRPRRPGTAPTPAFFAEATPSSILSNDDLADRFELQLQSGDHPAFGRPTDPAPEAWPS